MLIKEYRICMPLTVEEYRIAQLYMIQKKSKVESTGQGSGVEIIKNEPYENGPGGCGQYTFKIYHIGNHLPAWFRSILPKSALIVEEEAWNSYPYTKTRYKVPIIDKFTLEIETYYFNDGGDQPNVFMLNDEDLKNRIIDYLDIASDPISSGDYRKEEDPKLYQSEKTNRGPLNDNWRSEYTAAQNNSCNGDKRIMCAYKLCKVEFKYWGMQTKIEKFIDDIGLRKTMLRAHRQAWCWQDEWYGLTIEDIRKLEKEAAQELAEKMLNSEIVNTSESTIDEFENPASENCFIVENMNDSIKHITSNNSAQYKMDSCETQSFLDRDDESFYDARSDFPSETDSFMTCRNSFSSDLNLSMDNATEIQIIQKSVLILVVHGGSLLDTNHEYHNKNGDISILRQTFDTVIQTSYPQLHQKIAMRLVACPSSVLDVLTMLNKLTPQILDQQYIPSSSSSQYYVPLAAIPLFVTESSTYKHIIESVHTSLNDRYSEFIRSEGQHFDGQVNIIADAIGSIFVYDILTKYRQNNSRPSISSSLLNPREVSNELKTKNLEFFQESDPLSLLSDISISPGPTSSSSSFSRLKLDFKVHQFFMLGSPAGLVQSFRYLTGGKTDRLKGLIKDSINDETIRNISINESINEFSYQPQCRQIYNLFHLNDPSSYRLEPLINDKFHAIPPMKISNYNRFPHGNDDSVYLVETLFNNPGVVRSSIDTINNESLNSEHDSKLSSFLKCAEVKQAMSSWWGEKRIDYALHCPDGIQAFPLGALPHVLHASYWESKDCAAFIIRQIIDVTMHQFQNFVTDMTPDTESVHVNNLSESPINDKINKLKSRPSVKFKTMCVPYRINMTANHRANDVIVLSGQPQILSARFMYGTFDMLTPKNEKVDIFIMNLPISHGHWEKEGNEVTDNSGRVQFHISESRRMPEGIYPIRMVLKADSSVVQFYLAVLPPNVETVVFSIDGSFAASVSISGKDPKVRPGSIDVARFWQDKGYLLIYISARPNMQQRHVQRWLAQHKFPFGMILFSDGVSTEPLKQKLQILARLIREVEIKIHCAYGSSKDVSIYRSLGLHSYQIFTLGRLPKHKRNNTFPLKDGYAAHLNDLLRKDNQLSKPSRCISNVTLRRSCFDIPIKYLSNCKNIDDSSECSYLG